MILVDGRQGEGGGQVLRTSLSLSALTGQPFQIQDIRANRSRPGLKAQHLTAVRAVAAICRAETQGAELDSTTLRFKPASRPLGGDYHFDVRRASPSGRSAGSVALIFQAMLWPLLFADRPSNITLEGGTFVPFSPPFHYLSNVVRPAYRRFGAKFELNLLDWGWMSAGGGKITAVVEPAGGLQSVQFASPTATRVEGIAAVTNLPSHIPHRMARRAHNLLVEAGIKPAIQPLRERGAGPGAGIVLWAQGGGASALGRKGLPADKVAELAVAGMMAFIDNGAAVDIYLADQLLVPMALAQGESSFTTRRLTRHTLTSISLLRRWLEVPIVVQGALDEPGRITIEGIAFQRE